MDFDNLESLDILMKEMESDTAIDQMNVQEKQMLIPSIKHKWVSKLIYAKKQLAIAKRQKEKFRRDSVSSIKEKIPGLPKQKIEDKINASEKMENWIEKTENLEIMVEYLEKCEKIMSSMTYDIKNIIDLIKMETT